MKEEKSPFLVGRRKVLSEIQGLLQDHRIPGIGVYGLAGVGKTALVKAAVSSVAEGFDVLIWSTMGRFGAVSGILEDIGRQVGLSLPSGTPEGKWRRELTKTLRGKKFLLVVDEVGSIPMARDIDNQLRWVGITRYSYRTRSKVVLISRSRFCLHAGWSTSAIREIHVRPLDEDDSWELFRRELGGGVAVDQPPTRQLAETVVAKCGGLPLALIKVSRAVASARTAREWENAIELLNTSPGRLPGMEDVLDALKSAFDEWAFNVREDELTNHCLLFCSLFPEDDGIDTEELGEQWAAESPADERWSFVIRNIISRLKYDGWLVWRGYGHVKVHSAVRMMALWLTGGHHKGPAYGRKADLPPSDIPAARDSKHDSQFERWRGAKRVLVMHKKIMGDARDLMPEFPHLITSVFSGCTCSYSFLRNLLLRAPALRSLNLSDATIMGELPAEIGSLSGLLYLNLSRTGITELPAKLRRLANLRHLHLRETRRLSWIPPGTIECLTQLRTLDLYWSGFHSFTWKSSPGGSLGLINLPHLLKCLDWLEKLGLSTGDADLLLGGQWQSFLEEKPRRVLPITCSFELTAAGTIPKLLHAAPPVWQVWRFNQLRLVGDCHESLELELGELSVLHLSGLRLETFINVGAHVRLRELHMDNCHGYRELGSWVAQLRSLKYLRLADCNRMEELLVPPGNPPYHGHDDQVLPCLEKISLCRLPRLRSISRGLLRLHRLLELEVRECPDLASLPLDERTSKTLRRIVGEREWWDNLELSWESFVDGKRIRYDGDTCKVAFRHHFRPLDSVADKKGVEVLHKFEGSLPVKQGAERLHGSIEIESCEQGGEAIQHVHEKRREEKLKGIESALYEEESEQISVGVSSPISLAIPEEGMEMSRNRYEESPLNRPGAENLHEIVEVGLSKIKGKGKLEQDACPPPEEEFVGEEGGRCIDEVDTAQSRLGHGLTPESSYLEIMKMQKSADSSVYVEGQERTLSRIREHLQDEGVRVIGIQGIGGLGKTTILRRLFDEFRSKPDSGFDVVIMVTVPKYLQHKKKIQKEIGEQLGLSLLACGPPFLEDMQVAILRQALSQKNFLLIMDGDGGMDLDKVGIPIPSKAEKCKIIFSTDDLKDMKDVEVVNINSLNESESWELFSRQLQDDVVMEDWNLKQLMKGVASKCDGLPLALITVGRAMRGKKRTRDWQDALEKLDGLAKVDLQAREQPVHYALRFSYDCLEDDTLRMCLLFCSLFPENDDIEIEKLIQYWIGEGLLQDIDIDSARRTGYTIISQLKAASLIEDGSDKETEVKMHNVIREMVLYLTGNLHRQTQVHSGIGLTLAPEAEMWRWATKISLMQNEIEILPAKIPKCPGLSTLLINGNMSLRRIPKDFFKHIPALRVLDLSFTGIEEIPKAVGLLSTLQFLNISNTYIRSLPVELGKLVRLKHLDLSYMSDLLSIPQKVILRLSRLQTLNLYNTDHWCLQDQQSHGSKQKGARIQDLKNLAQLRDLGLTIISIDSLEELQSNSTLLQTTRSLGINQIECLKTNLISDILGKLEKLEVLHISEAPQIEELQFPSDQLQRVRTLSLEHLPLAAIIVMGTFEHIPLQMLRRFHITGCHGFKGLKWVDQLPSLEYLELRVCYGIEEMTLEEGAHEKEEDITHCSFPRLRILRLWDLPRLKRISKSPLSLPSLEYLDVFHCPNLKKLPFKAQSAKMIREICGQLEWWGGLEWDQESVKANFIHHFKDSRSCSEMTCRLRLMGSNH